LGYEIEVVRENYGFTILCSAELQTYNTNFSAEVRTYYGNFYMDFKGEIKGNNILRYSQRDHYLTIRGFVVYDNTV